MCGEPMVQTAHSVGESHGFPLGERDQVRAALNPRAMAAYLGEAFDPQPTNGARTHPACYILDVKYEPGDYCTILYRLGERLVIGTLRWGGAGDDVPAAARTIEPLGMLVFGFEEDPALPGLRVALDPAALRSALAWALPECRERGMKLVRCQATPLRYRPGKRCTLRLDLWLSAHSPTGEFVPRTLFGKAYHKLDKAASVYREMQMLSNSEPACEGRVAFAPAVAFLPELQLVLQGPVEGEPLEMFLEGLERTSTAGDRRAWDGVIKSAPALAAVHAAGLATDRERPVGAELERFVKRSALAATVDPAAGARLGELAAALPDWYGRLPEWGAEVCLVHGDCKPSQFLIGPRAVVILDFDHCGMADPASDVGNYLASLRQFSIRQPLKAGGSAAAEARTRRLRALEDRFLEEYCAASGKGADFRKRAGWYEAVALMRKALRSFSRSPRSPMPLAQVEEAWRCLEEI